MISSRFSGVSRIHFDHNREVFHCFESAYTHFVAVLADILSDRVANPKIIPILVYRQICFLPVTRYTILNIF